MYDDSLITRRHDLVFQARMNISYHEHMERCYEQWLHWTSFASLIFASAVIAVIGRLLPIPWASVHEVIIAVLAFAIVCLNGSVLAFGPRMEMVTQGDLKKQWILFLSRIPLDACTGEALTPLEREFHELNAQEPAPNRRRLDHAYREACKSLGLTPAGR